MDRAGLVEAPGECGVHQRHHLARDEVGSDRDDAVGAEGEERADVARRYDRGPTSYEIGSDADPDAAPADPAGPGGSER